MKRKHLKPAAQRAEEKINFRLPADLAAKVRAEAGKEDVSISKLIVRILRMYLNQKGGNRQE